jgi:hypothetical protein
MKLVIDRNKWLRGEGHGESYLLRKSDGKMCCLGFYGIACGIPQSMLVDVTTPSSVHDSFNSWGDGQWLLSRWRHCESLMDTNDLEIIDDNKREKYIAAIFAEHDVQVEFVGE